MSYQLCSLPWCRKPIADRYTARNFPPDRPSQLAWLDILDAGTWFSIPPETLSTGLVLCECHFDAYGNVKGRYEIVTANIGSPNVKAERMGSIEDIHEILVNAEELLDDSDWSAAQGIDDVQFQSCDSQEEPESSSYSIGSKRRKLAEGYSDVDEEDPEDIKARIAYAVIRTHGDDIPLARLAELQNDAIRRSKKPVKISTDPPAKRKSATLMEKMEVIRMVDKGMKQSEVSKLMNIPKSTVNSILTLREKIEKAYRAGAPLRKRIVRKGAFQEVNEAVYKWYENVRTQNLYVNARVLLTMAENIANELGRTDFTATPNWLTRFKERYNIRFSSTPAKPKPKSSTKMAEQEHSGECERNDDQDVEDEIQVKTENADSSRLTFQDEDAWLKKDWLENRWPRSRTKDPKTNLYPKVVYKDRDIFFVEELGILYRVTPKQAWQFKMGKDLEALQSFNITEERLTVVLCSNSDGSEKRKLLVVGQEQSDLPNNLPVDYVITTEPSNWITKPDFARWVKAWNDNLMSQERRIILLANSSPIHCFNKTSFSNIRILNIPTRILQSLHPVNFGIAKSFKSRYRRLLLKKLINLRGLRPVTYLEAMCMFSTAWNEVQSNLIKAAFFKAGISSSQDIPNLDDEEECNCSDLMKSAGEWDLAAPLSKYSFAEYVKIDNSLCAVECTTLTGTTEADESVGEDNLPDTCENQHSPDQCDLTAEDAQASLENLRLYAMSRESCPQEVHNAISTLESFILGHQ